MFVFSIMAVQWKSILVLFFILVALIPAYVLNQFLQKLIRPKESIGRLFLYLISGMITVFVFVAVLVLLIKLLFPEA
jgi:hypothetical protein